MKLDPIFVKAGQKTGSTFFTELGVYKVLMKSNKPIAD
jgi:prophage antirepressor-like protein